MFVATTNQLATPRQSNQSIASANGLSVHGVWSNGITAGGTITLLSNDPAQDLTPETVTETHAGSVLIVGGQATAEGLYAAASIGVNVVVAASMAARTIAYAQKLPMAVVLTNGFGKQTMAENVWMLFLLNTKRTAQIVEIQTTESGLQKATLALNVSMAVEGESIAAWQPLEVGQQVRILDALQPNMVGLIVALSRTRTKLASGLREYTATVRLLSGEEIEVPLANLQIFEQYGLSNTSAATI